MFFAAMLVNAFHAAFENAVVAFNRIRVDRAAHIFIRFVTDALMAREVIPELGIMAAFIGHHRGFFRNIGLDDRDYIGRAGSLDMERANLPAIAVNERKHRILVAVAAPFNRTIPAADKSFIRFNGVASAAHRCKLARAEGFTNAMREEPCTLVLNAENAVKLMRTNALLRRAKKIDRLKHLMQREVGRLENRANLHRELLAAIGALVKANAGFAQIIMLAAYRAAMRANRAFRPQNAFEMSESCAFIVKVTSGNCGSDRHSG